MTDYFALLDEPRRPWLDAESLKKQFFTLSAQVHPDRVHQAHEAERNSADQRYKELNAAFNCLREPRDRLRHLLELERGVKPAELQSIPEELAELGMKVGQICRDADEFIVGLSNVASPLLRAQKFEETQGLLERLLDLQKTVARNQARAIGHVQAIDEAWAKTPVNHGAILHELEGLYRILGFFLRWSGQIQEQIVRLAF